MERLPRNPSEADKLLQLSDLLRTAALTVKEEWAKEDFSPAAPTVQKETARILPSVRLWEATKTIEAISGALVELVCEPNQRVQQILSQFFESRALFIAAERRIPDLLAEAVDDKGVEISVLAGKTRIEASKLYLLGSKGGSFDVCETALQESLGIDVPLWEWMAKKIPIDQIQGDGPGYPSVPDVASCNLEPDEEGLVFRPELNNFALAMAGGGKTSGAAHAFGGFVLQLLPVYPQLKFVVQDRAENVEQGETVIFPREAPDAISSGRVTFMAHDFFEENPVEGAAVYWLRGILHDWSDTYCTRILLALKPCLLPTSKILICDPVMNTTFGGDDPDLALSSAPAPLPANYGYHTRYAHNRDLALMATINGMERTPRHFRELVEGAGLKVKRFWDVRSCVGVVEVGV
ncbi:MAG: hypothetical protein Q9169_003823 [Polycauliona sp. 2 TL-2023]